MRNPESVKNRSTACAPRLKIEKSKNRKVRMDENTSLNEGLLAMGEDYEEGTEEAERVKPVEIVASVWNC
jgi:hypothetical protein